MKHLKRNILVGAFMSVVFGALSLGGEAFAAEVSVPFTYTPVNSYSSTTVQYVGNSFYAECIPMQTTPWYTTIYMYIKKDDGTIEKKTVGNTNRKDDCEKAVTNFKDSIEKGYSHAGVYYNSDLKDLYNGNGSGGESGNGGSNNGGSGPNIGTTPVNPQDTATILTYCGGKADEPEGEGIKCLINTAVDIMTVGVGILGVIGIMIFGIQYLTAGGNEERTRKAKRRLFEIVIGMVCYVLIYAVLKWLLPGFKAS